MYKRLKIKNPDILEQYDRISKEQEEGVIEDANNETTEVGCVHYLPHREIIRDDKETTKMRIVFDGSAKLKYSFPLNDTLEKGPNMLPKIFDIIIRFRYYKYALISDIKSACHCIRVNKKDRDLTRFLWFDDIKSNDPKIIKKRYSVVLFGLAPAPFLLSTTVAMRMEKYRQTYEEIVIKFLQDLYMDDSVTGAQTRSDTYKLYEISKNLMLEGGGRGVSSYESGFAMTMNSSNEFVFPNEKHPRNQTY